MNESCIHEESKSRLSLGYACYHALQNLLSSGQLSKIYKSIIFPVVLCGCGTWSLTLRKEHRFRMYEDRLLRRIFGLT
jgi:hypothetical protein